MLFTFPLPFSFLLFPRSSDPLASQNVLASLLHLLKVGPKKNITYTNTTRPTLMNPSVANAHLTFMFANIATPACAHPAAMRKLGIRNAAMAEAATFGYESVM